jgi:DNA (cytosine-5)-methyltransferase 1
MVDCISLFSGAGGLDIGAEMAGARVRVSVEIDKDSVATLRLNDPRKDVLIYDTDIVDVDFKPFCDQSRQQIVIGGPPCL